MSDFFKHVEVKVPNRSGEDKSFQHLFSLKCGTLVPAFWDEVIPGTKVYLKAAFSASLPPLASDTFMRVRLKSEAFFVPLRQLTMSFAPWLTGDKVYDSGNDTLVSAQIPQFSILSTANQFTGPGTLCDYLGYKITSSGASNKLVNPFPFIAYHWIWDQMYRNSKLQQRAFHAFRTSDSYSSATKKAAFIPYMNSNSVNVLLGSHGAEETLFDGKYLTDLRQRNFDADYFTTMTLNPQSVSTPAAVTFQVDSSGNGQFTIAALRAQNSLQQYLERQNLAGFRLTEFVAANYGVNLSEGMAQMPLFLGRQSIDVYSKGVETNAETASVSNNNPFAGTVGARYGNAYAIGENTLIEEFEAKEPGIIMVLVSIVPKVTYGTGIDPLLLHFTSQNSQSDVANPLLQNVGQQAVRQEQLTGNISTNNVFGYTDRYAEFMTKVDRVSGLLRDGQSLDSFALQRTFGAGQPVLSSSFIQIPTTYMDQVSAVSSSISNYGAWVDSFFEYKISHPLAKYSIPSLQDPAYEHGKGVILKRTGQVVD